MKSAPIDPISTNSNYIEVHEQFIVQEEIISCLGHAMAVDLIVRSATQSDVLVIIRVGMN